MSHISLNDFNRSRPMLSIRYLKKKIVICSLYEIYSSLKCNKT